MSDPTWAVQKAIYSALSGNVTHSAAAVPVYDNVPQGTAYPYIVIDEQVTAEADYLGSRKDERTVYLSVWSSLPGKKQVIEIMASIDALLHRQVLELEAGTMIRCFVKRKSTQRDIEQKTYQGLISLRIVTTH